MKRPKKYIVDGRLKLESEDIVKITSNGRKMIFKNMGITIGTHSLFKVDQIRYDISEKKFFAKISSTDKSMDYGLYMPIGDLIFFKREK